jgi:hypothetical protein
VKKTDKKLVLHIPAEISNHSGLMKSQIVRFAYRMCTAIDYLEEVAERSEFDDDDVLMPIDCEEDPVEVMEDATRVTLDIWMFANSILHGEQTQADIMKRFIEQKKELQEED